MKDQNKNNEQLIGEIELLNSKIAQLEEENKQFKIITENTSDNIAITTFDLKAKYLYVSPSIKSVLGYESEDLVGNSFFDFIHPEDKKALFPLLKKYLGRKAKGLLKEDNTPISETIEFRFRNKAGEWRHMHSTLNVAGKNLLAVTRDITERKTTEKELKRQRDLFELIINSVPTRIFWKDLNSIYLGCNLTFAQDAGIEKLEDVIGKDDFAMAWKENAEKYQKDDEKIISTGKPKLNYLEEFVNLIGEKVFWQTNKMPLTNSNGKVIGIIAASENITKQLKAENTLQESKTFNETILNTSPDIIYIYDIIDNKNTYSNEGINKILGYSIEEVQQMGENILSFLMHPDDFQIYLNETFPKYQNLKDNELLKHEYRMKHKNGSWIWLESRESIFSRRADGTPKQIFGLVSDISERLKAEEKLLQEKEYYSSFVSSIKDWVWEMDLDGIHTFSNPSVESILGYKVDEVVGEHVSKLWTVEDQKNNSQKKLSKVLDNSKGWKNSVGRFQHKNGTIVTTESSASPILNSKNELVGFRGVDHDITERLQVEQKMNESEKKYRELFENSILGIYRSTPEGKYEEVNPAFSDILGYDSPEELIHAVDDISKLYLNPKDRVKIRDEFAKFGYVTNFETQARHQSGKVIWISINGKQHTKSNGQIYYEGTIQDITERKLAEEELHKYRDHLEELVKERTAELENKNKRLEDFNKLFVGREFRIKELRTKVKELEEKLGI